MRVDRLVTKALKYANGDAYVLSLMISKRTDELTKGAEPLVKVDKNRDKLTDIALKEISEGKILLDEIVDIS